MGAWDSFRSAMNGIPVAGGLYQSVWGSPEQEKLQQTTADVTQQLEQSRGQRAQQAMNVMRQSSLAFQPLNALMGGMYGPQAQVNYGAMTQNPLQGTQHPAFAPPPPAAPPAAFAGPTWGTPQNRGQ